MVLTVLTHAGSDAASQTAMADRASLRRRPRRVVDIGAALNLLTQTTIAPASGTSLQRHGSSNAVHKSPAKGIVAAIALSLPIWALITCALLALLG
jgi:hypothetical protein